MGLKKRTKKKVTKKQKDVFRALDMSGERNAKDKTVKEIAKKSKTSLSHTYKVLNKLSKHGGVLRTSKRPKMYYAIAGGLR